MRTHWEKIGVCSKRMIVTDAGQKVERGAFRNPATYLPRDKIFVARDPAPVPKLWPGLVPQRPNAAVVAPLKIKGASPISNNPLRFETFKVYQALASCLGFKARGVLAQWTPLRLENSPIQRRIEVDFHSLVKPGSVHIRKLSATLLHQPIDGGDSGDVLKGWPRPEFGRHLARSKGVPIEWLRVGKFITAVKFRIVECFEKLFTPVGGLGRINVVAKPNNLSRIGRMRYS